MPSPFSLQSWIARWKILPVARVRQSNPRNRLGLERLELRLPPGDLFGLSLPSFTDFLSPPPKPVAAQRGTASPPPPPPAQPGAALIGSNLLLPPTPTPPSPAASAGSTPPNPTPSLTSSGTTIGLFAGDPFALTSAGSSRPLAPQAGPTAGPTPQIGGGGSVSLISTGGTSPGSSQPLPPPGPPTGFLPPPYRGPVGGNTGGGGGSITSGSVMLTGLTDPLGRSVVNRLTNATSLTLSGTAPANATLQISLDGRNLATTRADNSGHFTYRAARLADGPHTFSAGLVGGGQSAGLTTTVDTKIPSIVLTGNDFVGARDFAWLSAAITSNDPYGYNPVVHIDVDLKHDGKFTDPGDADYATFTGTSGAMRTLPEGTYQIEARVMSNAGAVGYSKIITMQFDPYAGLMGSQALMDLALNPPPLSGPGLGTGYPGVTPAVPGASGLLRFDNGRVEISARATLPKYFAGFEKDLQSLGMEVLSTQASANMVTGWIPIAQLWMLPSVAHFSAAVPVYQPETHAGSVQTEGDKTILGNTFRSGQKVDGTGVKVGVLSDSVSKFNGGLADSVKTGDLPNNVQVLEDDPNKGGTDEGRAMLEIIHDVAPGSALAFYTGFVDPTDFAAGIGALAGAGARVINDDVGYGNSPIFNDGRIAQAVDQVVAQGVVYASAAGNEDNQGYRAAWSPLNTTVDGKTGLFQSFGGSALQQFTLAKGDTAQITFQWDNAFLEGGDPAANFQVKTDMIVYVVDTSTNKIVATQDDNNANTDQADELLSFTNSNGSSTANNYAFAFELKAGTPAPTQVAWIDFGSTNRLQAAQENAPTTFGQPVAKGAIGVAAVDWKTPTKPESFTSLGGNLQIYFDSLGNRLATPETRNKPDVTGPDGVHTSFFGSADGKGGFEFFGTSAATPHVAAAAALLMQQNPSAANTDIVQHLEATAIDLLTPGFDSLTGAGLIQLTPLSLAGSGGSGDRYEYNETSDAATDIGLIGIGSRTFSGLTIADHPDGFSDYDWYRATTSADGRINVSMDDPALELHLFTFDGTFLVPAANGEFISASQYLYVEVKGINIAPGKSTQGAYNMKVGLT